jgi:hypothetical protein
MFAAATFAAGCGSSGPKMTPVSGVVTLDGAAVEGAAVMLAPMAGGRPATGVTDAAGRFELRTLEEGDGALVGKHKVTVVKKTVTGINATEEGLEGEVDPAGIQETWITPEKYARPQTSGLTAEVAPGMSPVLLQLTSE